VFALVVNIDDEACKAVAVALTIGLGLMRKRFNRG
jgi:hypothetical protein